MKGLEFEISDFIQSSQTSGLTPIILIDGPAGSGKSTLAAEIAKRHTSDVLHMDDFYNGWAEPLDSALYDRVRLALEHLENPQMVPAFQIYDWRERIFKSRTKSRIANTFVIEGVGSFGLPIAANYAPLKIWTLADSQKCFERVLKRDGDDYRQLILDWQAHEANYFHTTSAAAQANLTWFT